MYEIYDRLLTFRIMIMAIGVYAVLQALPRCLQKHGGQGINRPAAEHP